MIMHQPLPVLGDGAKSLKSKKNVFLGRIPTDSKDESVSDF